MKTILLIFFISLFVFTMVFAASFGNVDLYRISTLKVLDDVHIGQIDSTNYGKIDNTNFGRIDGAE